MKLHILGFSPPYPNKGIATSSYILETDSTRLLIDCGHGAILKLLEYTTPQDLSAIIISHMHPDHFYDLISLRNCFFHENLAAIPLFLPPGGLKILQDVIYATRLPEAYMETYFTLKEYDPHNITKIGDLQIQMQQTIHPINTYAMKFSTSGEKYFIYTSDTAWSEELVAFCKGADVLLIESTDYPPPPAGQQRWHLTPQEAEQFVQAAQAKKAIFTHYPTNYSAQILAIARRKHSEHQIFLAQEHKEYII